MTQTLKLDFEQPEPKDILAPLCVQVAVPLPIENTFTYALKPDQASRAKVGMRVRIPFKNRETFGFIVGFQEYNSGQKLKEVLEIPDEEPVLTERTLQLTRWLANYYFSSWGEAIETAVPHWVKKGKRIRPEEKDEPAPSLPKAPPLKLTAEQEKAWIQISASLKEENPRPILLYGVTGSGKTELYIRAVKEVLKEGKGAIVLVPEIALTEQIRRFFYQHLGNELEIIHSKLSDGERYLAWKRIESGKKRVLLGPRSAIFAPLPRLGLILIDEEHEGSYKQDQVPRYHAREVALWLARKERAQLILGSATPSLESNFAASQGNFQRIDLTKRVEDKKLPEVRLIDLRHEMDIQRRTVILSRALIHEIEINLKAKEGTLLLLNRRGFSTHVQCPGCGEVASCKSCEVSLTFHQEENILLCHYCNYRAPISTQCAKCAKPILRFTGFGTEKVESELGKLFPQAKIARIDSDSIRKKGSHEKIIQDFRDKKSDILVGTQMIAKGFDFPHVTLVGVVLADVALMLPDFRSGERTFQLLTQVAGRAGRGEKPGRVIIQTFSPEHPSIVSAKAHDYLGFYSQELEKRVEHGYPPAQSLINILIRSKVEKKAYLFARQIRHDLANKIQKLMIETGEGPIEILGPAPLPFYRLRGHYRWHVLLKAKEIGLAQDVIRQVLSKLKRASGVAMQVDVNPLNIL